MQSLETRTNIEQNNHQIDELATCLQMAIILVFDNSGKIEAGNRQLTAKLDAVFGDGIWDILRMEYEERNNAQPV
jgi:hypothetical protein